MAKAKGKPQGADPEAAVKALGLKSMADFRRADLTSELRRKAGLSVEDEHRLAAVAELCGAGVPLEVARALSISTAVGSAAELASLTIEEVERVLQEEPVMRLLPEGFEIDRHSIENWLSLPLRLTADEEAPGRDAASEAADQPLASDEDPAVTAEDRLLMPEEVQPLLADLDRSWQRTQNALKRIASDKGAAMDAEALRSALADLQGTLAGVCERTISSDEEFATLEEDTAESDSVEDLDTAAAIVRLQDGIRRMEVELETLRMADEAWSEDTAASAAAEEDGEAEPVVEREE